MKNALPILIAIAVAAGLGWGACHGLGVPSDPRNALVAAGAALTGALLALGALRLGAPPVARQDAVAQSALLATVVHLFATCGLAGVARLMHMFTRQDTFLVWLGSFYWSLLAGLVVVLVRRLRTAPAAKPLQGTPAR